MFRYAVKLTPDPEGGFVVTLPAFPEATTQGETREEALAEAADLLDEAIAARIIDKEALPMGKARGTETVAPSLALAAKAAFYVAARDANLLSPMQLAQRLGVGETEARRLLDPRHETRLSRLDAYLRILGVKPRIEVDAAA